MNNTNLYNSDGKLIDYLSTVRENFIMLISPVDVKFTVISGGYLIDNDNEIVTEFTGKIVTLHIDSDNSICELDVNNLLSESDVYHIMYKDTNIIPQHYETLISNKNLPSNSEILSCIVDKDKYMILGKLLLEYKTIMQHKGTIGALENFMNFIGFKNITLFTEYKNGTQTSLSKSLDSVKTGNYHVIYEHDYETDNFDNDNFPIVLRDDNIVDFIDTLWDAITVAKQYFLIPEQDISFFGINFSTNVGRNLSIASNVTAFYETNPSYYLEDVNLFNLKIFTQNRLDTKNIIDNAQFVDDSARILNVSELKMKPLSMLDINKNIFYITEEILDSNANLIDENEIENYVVKLGVILNLDFLLVDKILNYSIKNLDDELIFLNKNERQLIVEKYENKIFIDKPGNYELVVDVFDTQNNRERFNFNFEISSISDKIDFNFYNSVEINENDTNGINLDVESTQFFEAGVISGQTVNPIHQDLDIPEFLSTYFDNTISAIDRYTKNQDRYLEKPFVDKYKMTDVTEMPMRYINNWIHFSVYEVLNAGYDVDLLSSEFYDNELLQEKHQFLLREVFENDADVTTDPSKLYLFVLNNESGIENEILNNDFLSFHTQIKLPLNYDFNISEEIVVDGAENEIVTINEYKSIYPRLTQNTKILKLNDFIYCKPDSNSVVNFKNIIWRIYDNITNDLIFETNDYSLKFRVNEKRIYDIEMSLEINGFTNIIRKNKCFSSFEVKL